MGVATISLILLATTLVAGIDQASGAASVDILDVVLSLKKEVTELTRKSEEQDSKIAQQDRRHALQDNKIAQQDRRIALQDNKIAQQDRRIALQDNKIAQQARRIAEQEKEIFFLKKKREGKESDITQLKKKIVEQENVVTELKRKDNEHEDMVEELKRNAGNQEEETTDLRKAMQQQQDIHRVRERQAPERVAFSVYLSHEETHIGIGEKVRFDAILLNEGNGYSPHIAAFTAPTKGIYLFAYNIAKRLVGQAWVNLMKNGNVINSAAVEVLTIYDEQHAGNVALVELDVGDVVYVEEFHQDDAVIHGGTVERFTTFSGALLI